MATLANAKSDPNYVFAEDYTTSGTIKPATESRSGIISITGTAFKSNGVATSVDFSSFTGILNLGDNAFYGATQLGSVSIGKGITSIGKSCFESSTISKFAVATDGATSTPEWYGTFTKCSNLSSVTLPNGVTSLSLYDSWGTFERCTKLSSVTLPSSLKTIGQYAFNNCSSLPYIDIPLGVTTIESNAFSSCNLARVLIPSSVSSIERNCFSGNSKLTSIVFGATSTSYGYGQIAFETNSKLTSIPNISNTATLPTNTSIYLSSVLPNVTSFTIPYAQTQLGDSDNWPFSGASQVSFSFSYSTSTWTQYTMRNFNDTEKTTYATNSYAATNSTLLANLKSGCWFGGPGGTGPGDYCFWRYYVRG